jgi:hypothetical protein
MILGGLKRVLAGAPETERILRARKNMPILLCKTLLLFRSRAGKDARGRSPVFVLRRGTAG